MGILCDVYDRLPRDIQYKIVLASLIVKLNNILSGPERHVEKLRKAKDLVDRIYSRFHEKEIENIKISSSGISFINSGDNIHAIATAILKDAITPE